MSDHAMPGTAQGIKEELLRAIDQSGKVSIFFGEGTEPRVCVALVASCL